VAFGMADKAQRKLSEFAQPLFEADEKQLAQLPYATQTVSKWKEFLIGPLAQLRNKQYSLVVTDRRVLLIRMDLRGKRSLEATYSRLSVTGSFKKGWFWGRVTLNLPGRPPLKLRVHRISSDAAIGVVASLPPMVGVPA
jgi:hypothetical protein